MVSVVDAQREILLDPVGTNVWVSIYLPQHQSNDNLIALFNSLASTRRVSTVPL